MGSKIKRIIIGIIFLLLAAFSALTAFYFLKVKPAMMVRSKIKSVKFSSARASTQPKSPSKQITVASHETWHGAPVKTVMPQEKAVSLKSLVKEAEKVYGQEENLNKEGFLWIDRKSARYVITLGALHGLLPGKHLGVYDGDQRIGQVIVDTPFDVISYVHPAEESKDLFSSDYYRVVVE